MSTIVSLREQFDEHDIRRVKIGGFDIDGVVRGKFVSLEKFWSVVENGMGFCDVIFGWDCSDQLYDQPTVTGWHTGYPDAGAKVDLTTFRVIPWEPNTACFLLDFETAQGEPLGVSPRQLLKRVLEKAASMDVKPTMAVEFEFFVYDETPWTLKDKAYRGARPLDPGMFGYSWLRTSQSSNLVHELIDGLAEFNCALEGFHTETGPGVFEAAIRYDDALAAADKAALLKTATKEICHRHGVLASFMAKPANNLPGCSGHVHQSLWSRSDSTGLFHEPSADHGVSNACLQYIAGQVALMPELCSLLAPNVNSYKRLLDKNWAPIAATWGFDNRTCALRVIAGSEKSTRIEHRLPGADLNPYIAMAAMIASGLHGIEQGLEPPAPITGNAYDDRAAAVLPTSLAAAAEALSRSELAAQLLGEEFVKHYLITRRWEVDRAERAVTDWELARYFEIA